MGVEVDVRTNNEELVLVHDAIQPGTPLLDWLKNYQHNGLILNTKEEGLEDYLIKIMQQAHVNDYFFLDQSYPFMIKWLTSGHEEHVAARISEYESIESLMSLPVKPGYLWCDSFTGDWSHLADAIAYADQFAMKVVLVSPELHGRTPSKEVSRIRSDSLATMSSVYGVCTKVPGLWIN